MSETLSASLPTALERRIAAVLEICCAHGLTIATAESCTGGLLASVLTDVDGSSHAFECAFVTYTDASKTKMLDVSARLLTSFGAVSRPVAIAMADGARNRSGADFAIATTGFAGPGAPEDEEGRVHLALAGPAGLRLHEDYHFGPVGRGRIRLAILEVALEMIETALGKALTIPDR